MGALLEPPGFGEQPGQYSKSSSLQKIQKLAGHGGKWLWFQALRRLRQEDPLSSGVQGCNELVPLHPSPGKKSETLSQEKENERRKMSL